MTADNHRHKSRGTRRMRPQEFKVKGTLIVPLPDFVMFQNFKHQIACITMPKLGVMTLS